jgi:hypothetical protein
MLTTAITVPGYVEGISDDVEQLIRRFGNCRRRAYMMKQKGIDRLEILRQLHRETGLPGPGRVTNLTGLAELT